MHTCRACGQHEPEPYLKAPDRFHARSLTYCLVKCPSCGLIWIDNPPRPAEAADHYGPAYHAFIRRATEGSDHQHWRRALATVHNYKSGGALLDLGCGSGSFLSSVRDGAWRLSGVEMSADAARIAREHTGAHVTVGDIVSASFPTDSFDVVTCFHVLEHVYAPEELLARVRTWLKPGGILLVHVPNIAAAEAKVFRSYWYPLELPRHLFHFSPDSLTYLAADYDYEIAEMKTVAFPFIEYSARYLLDDCLRRLGISRPALAFAPPPTLAWRVIRKGLRMTLLPVISAAIRGNRQIIEAVLKKPESQFRATS